MLTNHSGLLYGHEIQHVPILKILIYRSITQKQKFTGKPYYRPKIYRIYSLQGNKLHPIKWIFHIVLFLVPQGNLKEEKINLKKPFLLGGGERNSRAQTYYCHTKSLSATNFMYWLISVEFMPIKAQGRASQTN